MKLLSHAIIESYNGPLNFTIGACTTHKSQMLDLFYLCWLAAENTSAISLENYLTILKCQDTVTQVECLKKAEH